MFRFVHFAKFIEFLILWSRPWEGMSLESSHAVLCISWQLVEGLFSFQLSTDGGTMSEQPMEILWLDMGGV